MRDHDAAAVELSELDLDAVAAGKQKPAPKKATGGGVRPAQAAGRTLAAGAVTVPATRAQPAEGGCPGGICPLT